MLASSSTRQSTPSDADRSFTLAPPHPRLAAGAVHVWRADLRAVGENLVAPLSPTERARGGRLRRERDRQLWTRAHGVLRVLLAGYLERDPRSLRFTTEAHGKPVLLHDGSRAAPGAPLAQATTARPSFNLSHSGPLALFAFTEAGPVGVDLELARRPVDELALATRAFGPAEARRLEGLDPATRGREFLRAWVRHEAALKCQGTGIGGAAPTGANASRPWIAQLEVGPRAAAAVAVQEPPSELCCWDWQRSSRPRLRAWGGRWRGGTP
jgi:4'-phosphopantetheinyl transferase